MRCYLLWGRSDGRSECDRLSWGNNSDIGRCSFFTVNFCLDDGWFLLFRDFSCSSIDLTNGGSLLWWASSAKDIFSCVLEKGLQSTRVYVHILKKENIQEISERWITWLVLESDGLGEGCADFLMTRLVKIFLFLVGTRGAALPENCLRLEADWGASGWTVIITFFIGGDPLQKRTSGADERKWNGSPLLATGSGPSCCCNQYQ